MNAEHQTANICGRCAEFVAQIFDLLYRRFEIGGRSDACRADCVPNLRRLQICYTADYKSALLSWRLCGLVFICGLLLPSTSVSQTPLNDLVFTVGTTIQDNSANNWSYVLLGSPDPSLLSGKKFAVYGKDGFQTNSGTFTLRGSIFQQSDATAINNLLNQSLALGEELTSLSNSLNVLFHKVPGFTNLTLAQAVAEGLQIAQVDPATAKALMLVGRTHPGLTLCAGQAFAEQIATPTTYELREVNPGTGAAANVVGRVTVVPGAPVILPAPGAPYQVVTNAPIDNLRIRLRWGTPDELRRLSLLSFGYNVWRIPRSAAEAAGYDVTPPTLAQLHSDPSITRANYALARASKEFSAGSGPGAADDPADPITYFFSDDNGRSFGLPPFGDGDEFYYFITARDVLGRDGLVSMGGLAKACRRLPPLAPTEVRVSNTTIQTNQPRLLITWQQNTNPADFVSEYWIYRWPNPSMALTNDSTPLSNRIGVVTQALNTNVNMFLDDVADSPTAPAASNFWYTVRAISQAACAQLLSPNSGPAWGVVRQRAAPNAPSGNVLGSCGTPVVKFQVSNLLTNEDGPDTANWNYRFTCQRRDPGIAWVQFYVTNVTGLVDTLAQVYFSPEDDQVTVDYSVPIANGYSPSNYIWCTVGTYYGLVSAPAVTFFTASLGATQRLEAVFLGGQLLETALNASDPLLLALNGGALACFPPNTTTPDPSGTVRMTFPAEAPLLIQVLHSNVWTSLGVYLPDSNGVYSVSYPTCPLCPIGPFLGCLVNLPAGNADCAHHIARASDDGPVAPIRVQFKPTQRASEYRLYRSVDGGPLTLMAQGDAPFDINNQNKTVVRTDDAMPPSASRLCYFAQVLDENGNGSPMSFLGCKEVKPPKLPKPVLAEPQAAGSNGNPLVTLNWFCPTSGVYRFQVMVQRADQPGSGQPTGLSSSRLATLAGFDSTARYAGLTPATRFRKFRVSSKIALSAFDEAQVTPPLGANFGPGPQFSLTASVVPNVPYNISVAAMDAQGNVGDASLIWKFTWVPPVVLPTVPWPARPLPPVKPFNDSVRPVFGATFNQASLIWDGNRQLDHRYPVGIMIGGFSSLPNGSQVAYNVGTSNFLSYFVTHLAQAIDPNSLIVTCQSSDPTRKGQPLLPIVVYRQQITNANFPRVSGNLTQVTPLLEHIAYSVTGSPFNILTVTVKDRLIAGGFTMIGDGVLVPAMFLRDQQPTIIGASYQYWVVRLNEKREIDEVIPAGTVDMPNFP